MGADDLISKIDALAVKTLTVSQAVDKMRDPAGTRITIQAGGVVPDFAVLQEVPDAFRFHSDTSAEAALRGHLKSEGDENDRATKLAATA